MRQEAAVLTVMRQPSTLVTGHSIISLEQEETFSTRRQPTILGRGGSLSYWGQEAAVYTGQKTACPFGAEGSYSFWEQEATKRHTM